MTTKIQNAIVLGIAANTAEAQREFAKVEKLIKNVSAPVDRLQKQMDFLNAEFDEGSGVSLPTYQAAMAKLQSQMQRAQLQAQKLRDTVAVGPGRADFIFGQQAAKAANLASRAARQSANAEWMREWERVGRTNADEYQKRSADSLAQMLPNRDDLNYGQIQKQARLSARAARQAANAAWMAEWESIGANQAQARSDRRALRSSGSDYMAQFDSPAQAARRRMREAYGQFRDGALDDSQYARAIKAIRADASPLTALRNQAMSAARFGGPVLAIETARRSVLASADYDRAQAKLSVFLGSAEKAKRTLEELRELSSKGISLDASKDSIATMAQFGVATKDLMPTLRAFGELTAGDSERLRLMSLAMGQVAAAGRLTGQDLLQFINAGANPLTAMVKQTGKSMAQLREEMSKGLITYDMVRKAFESMVAPGGKFNGVLDEISKTSAGQLARAKAEIEGFQIAFGKLVEPATVAILRETSNLTKDLAQAMRDLGSLSGTIQGALGPMGNSSIGMGLRSTIGTGPLSLAFTGLDSMKAMYQSATGQYEEFTRTVTRLDERTNGVFSRALFSKENQQKLKESQKVLADLENVVAKIRSGAEVTKAEKFFGQRAIDQGLFPAMDALEQEEKKFAAMQARLAEAFEEPTKKLREQIAELRHGKDALAAYQALIASLPEADKVKAQDALDSAPKGGVLAAIGASVKDIDSLREASKEYRKLLDAQKEFARLKKDSDKAESEAKKARKQLDDMKEQSAKLKKGPRAELVDALSRLDAMRQMGMVDTTMMNKERDRLANEAIKDNRTQTNLPPALTVGSQEAYKALVSAAQAARDQNERRAERALVLQEAMKVSAEETTNLLGAIKGLIEEGDSF